MKMILHASIINPMKILILWHTYVHVDRMFTQKQNVFANDYRIYDVLQVGDNNIHWTAGVTIALNVTELACIFLSRKKHDFFLNGKGLRL